MNISVKGTATALIGGLTLGTAWLVTGQLLSAILGWLFVYCLILALRSERPYLYCYIVGLIALPIGFYWLPYTMQIFGGFSLITAYFLLLLFVAISAGQFVAFAVLYRAVGRYLKFTGLSAAISWLAAEVLWIRIFPWEPAHTQLAWSHMVQIADLAGSGLVTALMFFVVECADRYSRKELKFPFYAALATLVLTLGYGHLSINWYQNLQGPTQVVALVQANISTEEKHNITLFKRNTERYIELTKQLTEADLSDILVIWPESVILDWIKDELRQADASVPTIPSSFALLSGALTYNEAAENFNSAIAIYPDGSMPAPYHKRILMPFGEYMPGSKWLPWLQDFNPLAQGFTAGQKSSVFEFPMREQVARLAPLICYEDIVPELSRDAVRNGAQALVNLTNDAWFGDSQAPFQHNAIASFRAIENRRYLVRSTNSGLTAVINPLGQVEQKLDTFSEGKIAHKITLIDYRTWYTDFIGNLLRYACLLLALGCLLPKLKRRLN